MANVQFVGYQIMTSTPSTSIDYRGLASSAADIRARCEVLYDAVYCALKVTDDSALKVFVLPEFYFRGGDGGSYALEEISLINEILDEHLSSPVFDNWIFILGTAVATLPDASSTQTEVFNISLIRRGGVTVARKLLSSERLADVKHESLLVCKEQFAREDFLQVGNDESYIQGGIYSVQQMQGALNFFFGRLEYARNPSAYRLSEHSNSGIGGGIIFDMANLRFVQEVCGDYLALRAFKINPKNVHIHILTSCGMPPIYSVAKPDGFLFSVDGIESDPQQHTGLYWMINRFDRVPIAALHQLDMNNQSHHQYFTGNINQLFSGGRGGLMVYPVVEV